MQNGSAYPRRESGPGAARATGGGGGMGGSNYGGSGGNASETPTSRVGSFKQQGGYLSEIVSSPYPPPSIELIST